MRLSKMYFMLLIILTFCSSLYSQKRIYLRADAMLNYQMFSSPDSVKICLDLARNSGVTDIIVEVKPSSGEVLYKSSIAPILKEWEQLNSDITTDYLQMFVDECHLRNLKIYASLNVFSEGDPKLQRGKVYNMKPDWQTGYMSKNGIINAVSMPGKASVFVNPANSEVQDYELSIIREIVERYSIDGIILENTGYDGIESGFVPSSQKLFEEYASIPEGEAAGKIIEWIDSGNGKKEKKEGMYLDKWIEWQDSVTNGFIFKVKKEIKDIRPEIELCYYGNSRYSYGVNRRIGDKNGKRNKYSLIPYFDKMFLGIFSYEADSRDVEKFNKMVEENTIQKISKKDSTDCIEGICRKMRNYGSSELPVGGIYMMLFKDNHDQFIKALDVCITESNGVVLLDASDFIKLGFYENLSTYYRNHK